MSGTRTFSEASGGTTSESTRDKDAEPKGEVGGNGAPPGLSGHLLKSLDDAELLLSYAAEMGVEVGSKVQGSILKAHFSKHRGIDEPTAANLLSALTELAAKVRPVTAESLRFCARYLNCSPHGDRPKKPKTLTRFYSWVALVLLLAILFLSVAAYICSSLSDGIRQDVDGANELVLKLYSELEPPLPGFKPTNDTFYIAKPLPAGVELRDVLKDLQQFAMGIRNIDSRTHMLGKFTWWFPGIDRLEQSRTNARLLELSIPVTNFLAAEREKLPIYQDVRYYGQTTREHAGWTFTAVTVHILPVFYALLGACAYLARLLEQQLKNRTLACADKHGIHFIIAAIGGFVVSLFASPSLTGGLSLPPLAFAFLVGYAVDAFFSFLEGLLQQMNRGRTATASAPAPGPTE
jgi:hypothetical protein